MFTLKNEKNNANEQKSPEKQTILSIYMYKIYNFLDNNTFGYIINRIFYTIVSIIITLIVTYPELGIFYFKKCFIFENMLFPKAVIIFYIMFNYKKYHFPDIKKMVKKYKTSSKKSLYTDEQIFGIPVYELLNHLFEEKHFKRVDIESKFLIPRNKYSELAAKMEEINILKRGENNSRILNEDYTREQIARAFIFCEGDIKKMYMPVTQNGSSFTRQPLAEEIKERISPTLA